MHGRQIHLGDWGLEDKETVRKPGTRRQERVFISGRITGDQEYMVRFTEAEYILERAGYLAINPAALPKGLDNRDYARVCFALIDAADSVMFLPGWQYSPGAKLERAYCEYVGKRTWELGQRPKAPAGAGPEEDAQKVP